jgi:hypothetical protein
LKIKYELKKKTEEILVKQLKSCERNIQELRLHQKAKPENQGEEVQAKGICNIFNKIVTENFPNLEKVLSI